MPAPRKYPDELRERAVREVRSTGRPVAHVARDLGIHKEALRSWVRQAEADDGERDDRLTTAERDELKELRKENAELRRANEILKAAGGHASRQRNIIAAACGDDFSSGTGPGSAGQVTTHRARPRFTPEVVTSRRTVRATSPTCKPVS
ncbi:hypothetical protein DIZ27_24795 [Streptomyces sp. NWU339]|uniref:transposase n=1 Tax=Streptomyces sp. NWU339 TaxID=2185284 RepID=UPI000D673BC0|nr:hypothetical protein DIZ27_24795 [Streptomyces sp. NWU339]